MKAMKLLFGFFAVVVLVFVAYGALRTVPLNDCGENGTGLACVNLPPGFSIDYYAQNVEGARSMALSPDGTVYVGSRGSAVYALPDRNKDNKADNVIVLAESLDSPNGVAFRNGSLYVAEITRIIRYDDIETRLENPPESVIVNGSFPAERSHAWKYIKFGPDGKLYIPVGMPCNVCNLEAEDARFGTIMRMEPNGTQLEIFARGIRNSVGFDWNPQTGELWFTDNGRDWLGDDAPPDELNKAPVQGMHFGFPYCHGGDIPDPEFGEGRNCSEFTPPEMKLGPHVAALGMTFYTGTMFPEEYRNQTFIAEHGSWNRKIPIGYRISLVKFDENGKAVNYEPFADGWLQGMAAWGRPVDVLVMPDGSMLVSDDENNAIYRISYSG
ncbi:MAG: PQQ-dependent sugar dehydrogenase [Methanosarcina sp.]